MKKTTLSLLALTAILLFSCSKNETATIQQKAPEKTMSTVKIVSDWLSMNFIQGEKYNPQGLEATVHFNPSSLYDEQTTTRMAFIRTADSYQALPGEAHIDQEKIDLSYLLTYASFTVMANGEGGVVPDASKLNNQQFRYIVVSNSLLQGLNIDWSDYAAVAKALNIQN